MMTSDTKNDTAWFSIHLFYRHDLNRLLLKLVDPILQTWYRKGVITKHFFIRYWEEGQHIRLRVKLTGMMSEETIVETLATAYEDNFSGSEDHDEAFRMARVDYVQELSRYGGPSSIRLAEQAFEHSSITAMRVLKKYEPHWDNRVAVSIALQAHLLFIKASGESWEGVASCLDILWINHMVHSLNEAHSQNVQEEIHKTRALFEASYIQQQASIAYLCNTIWKQEHHDADDWRSQWSESARTISRAFDAVASARLLEEPQWLNELLAPPISKKLLLKWSIWSSYFHMTNNRLGIHPRDEPFIYYCLKNGISSLSNEDHAHSDRETTI